MSTIPLSVLDGPRLKVERANRHIDELIEITSPRCRALYEIVVQQSGVSSSDFYLSSYELTFLPKQPIPETLALIIGDAIHNLRSALDHLATGIVRAGNPGIATTRQHFPFHEHRKDLITHKDLLAIEKALPGTRDLILDEINPCSETPIVWAVTRLDQIDKHNFILPVVSLCDIRNIFLNTRGMTMRDMSVRINANDPNILIVSDNPILIEQNFEATIEVKFGKGTLFEDEPVIPTLNQMSQFIIEAIESFYPLINTSLQI